MKRDLRRTWTANEESILRALWPTTPRAEIARKLGRAESTVKSRAAKLRLHKGSRKVWTAAEDRLLRRTYTESLTPALATRFGCKIYQVYGRAHRLGLHKDKEFVEATNRALGHALAIHPKAVANRIPKGNVPLNKGLRRPGWFRGRMRETQFKKGQRVHNQRNVGDQRVCDGYLYTKISEIPRVSWTRNWRQTHYLIWEKAHGPIPSGHLLRFKDGDRTKVKLSNLELITPANNMRRNTIHHLPGELKEIIYLKGRLSRQIRRRSHAKQTDGPAQPPVRDDRVAAG